MSQKKIVLGFSGGLDTTYCVKYLSEEKGYEVHSVIVNTGGFSDDELKKIEDTRVSDVVAVVDAALKPAAARPEAPADVAPAKKDVKDESPADKKDNSGQESVRESGLRKVWDFFGRMFNRSR